MVAEKKVAVLYHIFYEDALNNIHWQLKSIESLNPIYFFNISADTPNQSEIREYLLQNFKNPVITISSNKGKDIGAKLLLIHTCLRLNVEPDWFLFLHDKKSHQALNASTWKEDLLTIIDPDNMEKIKPELYNEHKYGIIAAQKYIVKEATTNGKFISNNSEILEHLLVEYNLRVNNFNYVAGTMFWGKAKTYLDFFKLHNPMEIRKKLEAGNVIDNFSGTYTHSWERILSWIPACEGLTIKAI